MKKILLTLLLLSLFTTTDAAEDNLIEYERNIPAGEEFRVDVSDLESDLEQQYGSNIFFEWDVKGASTQVGSNFKRTFQSSGEKEINVTGYQLISGRKAQVYTENIQPFIYESALGFIYDGDINQEQKDNLISIAAKSGVYLYELGTYYNNTINGSEIVESLKQYDTIEGKRSDYIGVWGGKDFILNATGQINKQILLGAYERSLKIAIFSSFNKDVLERLVSNFLSEKNNISSIIISDDQTRFQAVESPTSMSDLQSNLQANDHSFIEVDTGKSLDNIYFMSKFINNLSSAGFKASDIYLITMIPILLLGLSIMKHLISFSPLGIMIPVGITLMLFQVGMSITLILMAVLFIANMGLAKIMSKYTLLYTPKVSFLIGVNIVVLMGLMNLLYSYNLLSLSIESIIFLVLFILIAEKMITLIIGKEFREYKYSLIYTLVFAGVSYGILSFNTIKIFILAYPEMLLLLIPINFFIGRFTGLRMTEYFRFREVITSMEEEE